MRIRGAFDDGILWVTLGENYTQADLMRYTLIGYPELPILPHLPDEVDPDAWVQHYHHKVFKRKTDSSGRISVGKHHYSLGYKYAKKKVGVWLDAKQLMLHFMIASEVVKSDEIQGIVGHKMPWNAYFNMMLQQARTENQ